jgi:glycosyltransferase involved in cell wall biosynthesis
MTSVSIVMATYNGARFLQPQLDSLATQTFRPLELIVSDDQSTDNTLDILDEFRERAPFPVFIERNAERLGYGQNFLSATVKAQGDLIAFCDQDDLWHENKLEVAVRILEQDGSSLFVHAATLIDEEGRTIGAFNQGTEKARLYKPLELKPWDVFYGFSIVFRRPLLNLIDPGHAEIIPLKMRACFHTISGSTSFQQPSDLFLPPANSSLPIDSMDAIRRRMSG